MRLTAITATAHPDGSQIDLAWTLPEDAPFPQVRVVRRPDNYPEAADDGVVVPHDPGTTTAADLHLAGERTYYYTLFPFAGDPPVFDPDPHNRVSATAISPYDFAGQLYALLPSIYRRLDTRTFDGLPGGQLRRFLDLPGGELDRLYSLTRTALGLTDVDAVDGTLLPLLAQWIGWPNDAGLPLSGQRNEIRRAPRLYETVGAVPTLDATVARIGDVVSRTKEFVHNVARSNRPERLNLWSAPVSDGTATGEPALVSVNFAYDGRPAAVPEADGSVLFFFHTLRAHGWDIWAKRYTADGKWLASEPVVDRPGIDKHPAAARQGDKLRLFWQSAGADGRWHLQTAVRSGGTWSAPEVLFNDPVPERRMPAAAADNTGGVWLFWLERVAGSWQVRYSRHDGTRWQPDPPATLPLDGGQPTRVDDDLFLLFHPTHPSQRLWLFWARHDPGGPAGQTRWNVAYRSKQGLDPNVADWSPVTALPRAGDGYHDRQPAALASGADLELYRTSTQHGGWSVHQNRLSGTTWGSTRQVSSGAYTDSGPLAVPTGTGTLLVFRSNRSLPHAGTPSGESQTLDSRYAGTTAVLTGAAAKLGLRGSFSDVLTYTYDTGRRDTDLAARDTVGLYLGQRRDGPPVTGDTTIRLAGELADFVPVTTRTVFIKP